ncbi:error-prone DNA polymerase [Allocatelliglobosispora scoriae]|uniref:Error-prone DNA polymerase n=2 Tax=Allocatelliglobosispora scoriae TaxID=643052 RepID=A0A841BRP5_9ACTN|nr:error-prone DNA polymerase [Allocatelliglobosispora scoriae]MBB5869402.1 error-prone DNA polymerase [Allocatelliglobosispora scoriae]
MSGDRIIDPLAEADGGDAPGFSRKRAAYDPPPLERGVSAVPYAELHCHSSFSFLDGASSPEELVQEAVRLGLSALAITDHDNLSGVVRFAAAAREHDLRTVFGAELGLTGGELAGPPDPDGTHLLVLARGLAGYTRLSREIGRANLRGGEKGKRVYAIEQLADGLAGHGVILTGCRKGGVARALAAGGPDAAASELDRLVHLFGRDNVMVELIDQANPRDRHRNDVLAELADRAGLPTLATGNVHFHHPSRRRLAAVVAAVRARGSLDQLQPYLHTPAAYLRSGDEMAVRFARYPGAVPRAAELGLELAFDLSLIAPKLPPFSPLDGHATEADYLRFLAYKGALKRYGPPQANREAYQRIDRELALIEELEFPGYFLTVWDIVRFCREKGIFCQGRGSAANSVVCYALWVTNVDPVANDGLIFERFLAPERDGPPDIDVDIESDRREEVIQYVYTKHGREHAAQVANVIAYRPRSAVRDVARAFGYSPGQQDAWSKQIDRWHAITATDVDGIPQNVLTYANQLLDAPRHLGIHSGGMVICDRPVIEVCPVEWARMPGRTVLQWDKDDCAAIDLVKFDLLGLGMLSALRYASDFLGGAWSFVDMPTDDPEIYAMLCEADTVGVFQVESRAQMSTLPRLRPEKFYDIVVEVALIRPGPIQGGSVHPFIRRKNGQETWRSPHPLMTAALERTLGVPLFQEQMMQLATDTASFSPAEADQLRRAMGAKRSTEKMERLRQRLFDGMAANGIPLEIAEDIYKKLAAFANYGFPESHAISFAYLVYASAWLKRYHPAAFLAALLGAQPMGFYSPQSLVDDARRHGVTVHRPDINASGVKAVLECPPGCRMISAGGEPPSQWGLDGPTVRLGLDSVRALGTDLATRIVAARDADGPFLDMADLARRAELKAGHLEALATAGAFACFGLDQREALWAAGAAAAERPDRLPGTSVGTHAPPLPGMDATDRLVADVWATGLSPDNHPIRLVRTTLDEQGALPIGRLAAVADRTRVLVGGLVTHRQRPATAGGIVFLSLEDETGMLNVVCSPGLWLRFRRVAIRSPALVIRGQLESTAGVINLVADRLTALPIATSPSSRDWR